MLHLDAKVEAPHAPNDVWQLLTDYEHLSSYMPNINSSRIVSRTGPTVQVQQAGTSRLILPWNFDVTFEFTEEAPVRLRFRQTRGNLRVFEGDWNLVPWEAGVEITYRARLGHGIPLPGFLITYIARHQLGIMIPALLEELRRRATSRRLRPFSE